MGKVLLFDDSFEHEVRNDTNEDRVVLLIRVRHPELVLRGAGKATQTQLVAEALRGRKRLYRSDIIHQHKVIDVTSQTITLFLTCLGLNIYQVNFEQLLLA